MLFFFYEIFYQLSAQTTNQQLKADHFCSNLCLINDNLISFHSEFETSGHASGFVITEKIESMIRLSTKIFSLSESFELIRSENEVEGHFIDRSDCDFDHSRDCYRRFGPNAVQVSEQRPN